jgi:SAM-dependent methyltransferase
LDSHFAGWEHRTIHESSPSNNFISRHCSDYSSSQYFENVPAGSSLNGVRCEDLERLSFEDSVFDLFITQDVFEHVFNPDLASKEIARVLKPGGFHVFTAPKHRGLGESFPRAKKVSGEIVHLAEENYHGNPVGDGRSLVTWDYGDNFERLYQAWSNCSMSTYIVRDRSLGLDGEYLEVFVSEK